MEMLVDGRLRDVDDINQFLKHLQLEKLTEAFIDEEIDLDTLPTLTMQELEFNVKVSKLGQRKKIMNAIATLRKKEKKEDEPVCEQTMVPSTSSSADNDSLSGNDKEDEPVCEQTMVPSTFSSADNDSLSGNDKEDQLVSEQTMVPSTSSSADKDCLSGNDKEDEPVCQQTMVPSTSSSADNDSLSGKDKEDEPVCEQTMVPSTSSSADNDSLSDIVYVRDEPESQQTKVPSTPSTAVPDSLSEAQCNQNNEIRLVLLGKTGGGKSATANTILGENMFFSSISASSVTKKCTRKKKSRLGKTFQIVDTPGLFDTEVSNEEMQEEICRCIGITSPGPHAFILVLGLSRFTEEEHDSVEHFIKYFGEEIYKYFIILFTRKDDLEYEGITLTQHIKTVPDNLKIFLQKCGGRCIAFNNRLTGKQQEQQVQQLLDMITENIENNNGECYTDSMYKKAEAEVKKQEEEKLKKIEEQRQKDLREMEQRIEKKYEGQIKTKEEEMSKVQTQINDILGQKKSDEENSKKLNDQIKDLEKQLKETSGKENDSIKYILESLRNDKKESDDKAKELERKRGDLESENRLLAENRIKLILERKEEEQKRIKEIEEKMSKAVSNARDEVRDEIEKNTGVFGHLKGVCTSIWKGFKGLGKYV